MLRKWMLSAVAGLTLLTPLAAVTAVQAKDVNVSREAHDRDHDRDRDRDRDRGHDRDRDHHHFEVMFRHCCNDPWSCYGSFGCYEEAAHAEHYLRSQGFEVSLR